MYVKLVLQKWKEKNFNLISYLIVLQMTQSAIEQPINLTDWSSVKTQS